MQFSKCTRAETSKYSKYSTSCATQSLQKHALQATVRGLHSEVYHRLRIAQTILPRRTSVAQPLSFSTQNSFSEHEDGMTYRMALGNTENSAHAIRWHQGQVFIIIFRSARYFIGAPTADFICRPLHSVDHPYVLRSKAGQPQYDSTDPSSHSSERPATCSGVALLISHRPKWACLWTDSPKLYALAQEKPLDWTSKPVPSR